MYNAKKHFIIKMLNAIFDNYLPSSLFYKKEELLKGDMPFRLGAKGIIVNQGSFLDLFDFDDYYI